HRPSGSRARRRLGAQRRTRLTLASRLDGRRRGTRAAIFSRRLEIARIGWPREVRRGLGWLSSRRSLLQAIRAWRELLPGDPSFGDPISTTGSDPARVLA